MADYRGYILSGSVEVGQQYGKAVLPNPWDAMLEVTGVTSTGDGASYKVISVTPINSPYYGEYTGGTATLRTSDNNNRVQFSDIPATIILSGYVLDGDSQGIDEVTVATNGSSGESSVSGNYFFSVGCPFTGTLTPTKTGYGFAPITISLTNRYYNVATNDFTGSLASPSKPINPTPIDAADDVTLDHETITWEDGGGATAYNVYYGDTSGDLTLVSEGQEELSFTIYDISLGSPFDYLITRYWRVDAVNDAGTTTGDEWSFTSIAFDPVLPTGVTLDANGNPTGTPNGENNIMTIKRLVAAGNDKVYYEDIDVAAGTMVELDTTGGAIDTSDQLNMFEAFQKVFIVNGANLKVADFINTKLTHTGLTTAHAHGDIITQDQGSSNYAYMVVDFTNTAKTATYGYAYYGGSATAFNTANSCTGSGSGTAFTPTTVTDKPHWYTWAVYPGSNQGAMPNKAYLGCLYRGRGVLSGDPEHPNQWYMTKVGNLWNFYFDPDDPLTAVRGGNADAGEIGDIIRALIPYKDDYLIFGCANSMWLLTGDPAPDGGGGIINHIDLTIGIFGSNSWCFDGEGNLYFWGTGGIHKMPYGFKSVTTLNKFIIPNIVKDEAADPTTHRVVLEYDRIRNGILICITKLSNGTNSNYFFDFKTEGFYPETYPEECGVYSSMYYAANDTAYADLLVGCKDGYIRTFKSTAKDDDIGRSDEAISSYFGLVQKLNEDDDYNGKLTSLTFELAGGASGGDFTDTDGISYDLYTGNDAETAVENMRDGDTAFASGTLIGTGRKNRIRTRLRAAWLAIKVYNSSLTQTWAINRIFSIIQKAGRIK